MALLMAGLAAMGLTAGAAAAPSAAKKPHLVFFLADDYGFADVSEREREERERSREI